MDNTVGELLYWQRITMLTGAKTYTLEEIKEELIDNKELYEFKLQLEIILEVAKTLYPTHTKHFLVTQLTKLLNEADKI